MSSTLDGRLTSSAALTWRLPFRQIRTIRAGSWSSTSRPRQPVSCRRAATYASGSSSRWSSPREVSTLLYRKEKAPSL
ncbi:unnamed protein product, partial [Nesidiocoris tenuis]